MQSSQFFISLCIFMFACICLPFAFSSTSSIPDRTHELYSTLPFHPSYYIRGESQAGKSPRNTAHYKFPTKYARFEIEEHSETNAKGVYDVRGHLLIHFPYWYGGDPPQRDHYAGPRGAKRAQIITFGLKGLWSEKSRQLQMLGSASWTTGEKPIILDVVLDLIYPVKNNPTLYTGYTSGTLKSTASANDPTYFDPFSMFGFPAVPNYSYSYVSLVHSGALSGGSDVSGNQLPNSWRSKYCWVMGREMALLEVEYSEECSEHGQHCSPLGNGDGSTGSSPRLLVFSPIQCSLGERKLRFVATFQNTRHDLGFGLNSTMIGEASWDEKTKELFGIACRLFDPLNRSGNEVEDCTMRLNLRYTSIYTIRNDSKLVGDFTSTRPVDQPGYFRKVNLTSTDWYSIATLPGVRYEYTELDRVRSSCADKEYGKKIMNTYPDAQYDEMKFHLSVENSRGQKIARAQATPLWDGNESYETENGIHVRTPHSNISYMISFISYGIEFGFLFKTLNWLMNVNNDASDMLAEGVYSAETGLLCMVGCRKLKPNGNSSAHTSKDCQILVKLEFAPLTGERGGRTKGTIKSGRARTDPLHFEEMVIYTGADSLDEGARTKWRMDLEILTVLMSDILVCIFVALQILHLRRNPEVPSFVSLFMLLILCVGNLAPLILNVEGVHSAKFPDNEGERVMSNGGRLEAYGITVRLSSLVALVQKMCLLQLVLSAKGRYESRRSPWLGETNSGLLLLSLYVAGGFLALLTSSKRKTVVPRQYIGGEEKYSVWGGLRSYGGLILDGFLLPQVVLNALRGSAEKAVCNSFYGGMSAVRVVPHVYNLYRSRNYRPNPDVEFYSRDWDVIVPLGILTLALIIFLQQR